ncbi:DUF1574 family protein [Leptospira santarosai]|uniref:PF07611 family protein n=1 Tax=Leptospira santarosai TaxID=28183 RepID=A0AB73LNN1_9LEPT|nr:DUF1574 family protein [Leptospira santarosai]AVV50588.1 PF07611 family protein [Leptospira santarosai]ONF93805.1 hypothetical protein BWD14_07155 [Leptospira santarosai]
MHKYKIQIFFILLLFFDKILLIPQAREFASSTLKANPYVETLEDFEPKQLETGHTRKDSMVWSFGTSRSFMFYAVPNPAETAVDRFTSSEEKQLLNSYDYFNFAAPGSNPALAYTRFSQLIDRGYKPKIIVVEISTFGFNENNRYNGIVRLEGIPLPFVLKNIQEIPWDYTYDIIVSRMFSMYRYKISFSTLIRNLKGEVNSEAVLLEIMSGKGNFFTKAFENANSQRVSRIIPEAEYSDFSGNKTFSDPTEYYSKLEMPASVLEKEFFAGFKVDNALFLYLTQIIRKAKFNSIQLVFWIPKIHPRLQEVDRKYSTESLVIQKISELAKQENIPIVDFRKKEILDCDYFQDISHLSGRCYTKMMAKILKTN